VVTIEVAKCYNSAVIIIETKRACGEKSIAGEAFRRKWPESGCWWSEESKGSEKEETGKASLKSPCTKWYTHDLTLRGLQK
jgi:hypothetical protein